MAVDVVQHRGESRIVGNDQRSQKKGLGGVDLGHQIEKTGCIVVEIGMRTATDAWSMRGDKFQILTDQGAYSPNVKQPFGILIPLNGQINIKAGQSHLTAVARNLVLGATRNPGQVPFGYEVGVRPDFNVQCAR